MVLTLALGTGCAELREPDLAAGASDALPHPTQGVQTATSRHGVVVAGHPQAAELGVRILEGGGNAMDAAVTVSLGLAVAEPYGSGLGGKLMMLYYDAAEGRVLAIDAMDQASSSLEVERFVQRDREERITGWTAVAVPGLVAGLYAGHQRWGRLDWRQAVRPAAELARRGSRVLPGTRKLFARRLDRIRVSAAASQIYLPGGELPPVGQDLANPDLAQTLETIARQGVAGFYRGWVAEAIAEASQRGGGSLTLEDLARYEARVVPPLAVDYGGFRVVSAPPPATGGVAVLAALAQLAATPWSGNRLDQAESFDRIARVLEPLYPRIQARIADVPTARGAFEELLAKAAPRRSSPAAASGQDTPPETSTTHFVVVDADGNIASVTQSLSHHFGAGVVAPGTGVLFNNTLKNFSLQPASVNAPLPGKRPRSTIAPTIVLKDGRPILALGVPGGQRIPTATLQVLLDYLHFETSLAEAVAAPRLHFKRPLNASEPTNLFEVEGTSDPALRAGLEALGWLVRVNEDSEAFGGFCAVEIHPDGSLTGVADQRRTNTARGAAAPSSKP